MGQIQILRASAGSGKTFRLSYEYVKHLIQNGYRYRHILAVTFTNKATDEMKRRILRELYSLSLGEDCGFRSMLVKDLSISSEDVTQKAALALQFILHDYSRFSIFTIDTFFQKILRSFVKELGLEADYDIDFDTNYITELAIDRMMAHINEDESLKQWIDLYRKERIDDQKNFDIKGSLHSLSKRLFDEEFDSVAMDKIRPLLPDFFEVLKQQYDGILEHLKENASKAVVLFELAGVSVDDFFQKRSGVGAYLKRVAIGGDPAYNSYVSKALDIGSKWGNANVESIKNILHPLLLDICSVYNQNIRFITTYRQLYKIYRTLVLLSDINRNMEEVCRDNNKMVLSSATNMLSDLVAKNDAQFIYEKCGTHYDYYMIDEFQDTSSRQWQTFYPILENAVSQSDNNEVAVTLVGDVKQSIYGWRGGDWRILGHKVNDDFTGKADIKEDDLKTNWRSKKVVVDFNNTLIERGANTLNSLQNEILSSAVTDGNISSECFGQLEDMIINAYKDVRQMLPDAKKNDDSGFVEIFKYDQNEDDENLSALVCRIESLQDRGYNARDIAILFDKKWQVRNTASYLLKYKKDNPEKAAHYCYDIISDEALRLSNSPTVRFVISCLTLSTLISRDGSIALAMYNQFLDRRVSHGLPEKESDFISYIRKCSLIEAFENILTEYNLNSSVGEIAYIQAIHSKIIEFSGNNICDAVSFVEWWNRDGNKSAITVPASQNAIILQTIHKSKGLQYKAVIIPYCEWDIYPATYNYLRESYLWLDSTEKPFDSLGSTPLRVCSDLENTFYSQAFCKKSLLNVVEKLNMLYVAVTRAEQELYIMVPKKELSNKRKISFVVDSMLLADDENITTFGSGIVMDALADNLSDNVVREYNSMDYHSRIKLRLPSQNYQLSGEDKLSPRSVGILMHKIFEQIEDKKDVDNVVDNMIYNGKISELEVPIIRKMISKAFENDIAASWFDNSWTVFREREILYRTQAGELLTSRPDRVIANGDKAVVIDYKFGDIRRKSYIKQVHKYMSMLEDMNYKNVTGYIWWVNSGEIEEVSHL